MLGTDPSYTQVPSSLPAFMGEGSTGLPPYRAGLPALSISCTSAKTSRLSGSPLALAKCTLTLRGVSAAPSVALSPFSVEKLAVGPGGREGEAGVPGDHSPKASDAKK